MYGNALYRRVTHFFYSFFHCLFQHFLVAVSVSALLGDLLLSEPMKLSFAYPPTRASALLLHNLPSHSQNVSNNTSPCSLKRMERTFKEHISFHFVSVLQESNGMFQLKVVVMIICLRSETDFLYVYLYLFSLLFLLAFL